MSWFHRQVWRSRLRATGKTLAKLERLRRWQQLSAENLLRLRDERLEMLLSHAFRHVPYYRQVLLERGVVEDGKVRLDRFAALPLLDKPVLRERFEELKSDDLSERAYRVNTSGGSTGEPARFVQDREQREWGQALKILFDEWTGYALGERKVVLWGSERDLLVGRETHRTHLGRAFRNELTLNAFRITPQEMRSYVAAINAFKPEQILAYVGSIYELASFVEREGLEICSPRAVMTSAGTLYPYMRETIERVFQTKVFNRYGSREVGDMACESRAHDGLYVSLPTHHLEILRPDGTPAAPGEVGEVVVTLLTNCAMPLIRYRIGDMAAWSEGVGSSLAWPRLAAVTGRVTDSFVKGDGTLVHGEFFTHLFYVQPWVRKFQFIQEEHDLIRVLVAPLGPLEEARERHREALASMTSSVKRVMGEECRVVFEFVSDIPETASGKYRYTVSNVEAA